MTLPTPVFLAGGGLCLVAGYLIGTVAGPATPQRTTATVVSYEGRSAQLCLSGDAVKDAPNTDENGVLCGTWSHSPGATVPREGDTFRFVTLETTPSPATRSPEVGTVIYGTVVD